MASHIESVCMTYTQHMRLSLTICSIMGLGAFKAFVHAFAPFWFVTSSSDTVAHVREILNGSGCGQEKTNNKNVVVS